jgi:hypothetical protein
MFVKTRRIVAKIFAITGKTCATDGKIAETPSTTVAVGTKWKTGLTVGKIFAIAAKTVEIRLKTVGIETTARTEVVLEMVQLSGITSPAIPMDRVTG